MALKRKVPLKRKTRLRCRSQRRSTELGRYYRLRGQYLSWHPICEICQKAAAQDIHHTNGRQGLLLLNFKLWLALCRSCHDEVHQNPRWARAHGYLA
jgi:hypothetical protein